MYEFEHSVVTQAPASAVYAAYEDVSGWPQWDTSIEAVTIDGPFTAGTTGTLRIEGQPPLAFRITAAEPGVLFSDVTEIPGAVITFVHVLAEQTDGGTCITHRVTVEGDDAERIGPMVTSDVAESMATLTRYVERASIAS